MSRKDRKQLEILHLDDHLAAVNKPPGVPVVPARSDTAASLREILAAHLGTEPFVVHRIDRDTSGVVLFARDARTHRELSLMFEHREVEKIYLAVVRGTPFPAEGTIELPLERDRHDPTRMTVARRGGKPSRTDYRTLQTFRGYALVEVRPQTGRMHQIRVHLAAIGHPLAVDPVYGAVEAVFLSEFKRGYRHKESREERPLISRLSLHAREVRLGRRLTGVGPTRFEASFSRDVDVFLKQLAKHASVPRPAH